MSNYNPTNPRVQMIRERAAIQTMRNRPTLFEHVKKAGGESLVKHLTNNALKWLNNHNVTHGKEIIEALGLKTVETAGPALGPFGIASAVAADVFDTTKTVLHDEMIVERLDRLEEVEKRDSQSISALADAEAKLEADTVRLNSKLADLNIAPVPPLAESASRYFSDVIDGVKSLVGAGKRIEAKAKSDIEAFEMAPRRNEPAAVAAHTPPPSRPLAHSERRGIDHASALRANPPVAKQFNRPILGDVLSRKKHHNREIYSKAGMLLERVEEVATVTGTSGFAVSKVELNPGLPELLPIGHQIAEAYDMYELEHLEFSFHTMSGSATAGLLGMHIDPDSLDAAPVSSAELAAFRIGDQKNVWSNWAIRVPGKALMNTGAKKFVRNGPVAHADLRLNDCGILWISTEGMPAGAIIGKIYVHIRVRLSISDFPRGVAPNQSGYTTVIQCNSTAALGASATAVLDLASVPIMGSAVTVDLTANTITIPAGTWFYFGVDTSMTSTVSFCATIRILRTAAGVTGEVATLVSGGHAVQNWTTTASKHVCDINVTYAVAGQEQSFGSYSYMYSSTGLTFYVEVVTAAAAMTQTFLSPVITMYAI